MAASSPLFIFSDGPKTAAAGVAVAQVRDYIRTVGGFASVQICEAGANAGLAGAIIGGVTRVCGEHGRAIVLEDDLVTSPHFLSYMNQALELYRDDERVASIHGYCYPVTEQLPETFFLRGADCWGWATWSRAWEQFVSDGAQLLHELEARGLERAFDFDGVYPFTQMLRDQIDGRNDSWAVRWHASCFLRDLLTLYPRASLVTNIGNDASGVHRGKTDRYTTVPAVSPIHVTRIPTVESAPARKAFARFLQGPEPGIIRRVMRRVLNRRRMSA
jgi:hypothetical protein